MESASLNFLPMKPKCIGASSVYINKYLDDKYGKEISKINERISQIDEERTQLKTDYETYYFMYTSSIKKAFEENKKEFEICKWDSGSSFDSQKNTGFHFGFAENKSSISSRKDNAFSFGSAENNGLTLTEIKSMRILAAENIRNELNDKGYCATFVNRQNKDDLRNETIFIVKFE
jgi:hypothetical protein